MQTIRQIPKINNWTNTQRQNLLQIPFRCHRNIYNPLHRYDEDVKEFFATLTYLGGKSTYNMIRGPISCKRKVDIHNPCTAQCSGCGMKQKLSSAVIHWFVKPYCQHSEEQDIRIHLTCTHFTLQNFPQLADVDFCSITEEELTDELLLVDSVKVTYDKSDKKIIDVNWFRS